MPTIPEELDVFYVPHYRMKTLVQDLEDQVSLQGRLTACTRDLWWTALYWLYSSIFQLSHANFTDLNTYTHLLNELNKHFHDFKTHERIENEYILHPLLPKLGPHSPAKLENDIHSDNQLGELEKLVELAHHAASSEERVKYGELLKRAISEFTVHFIPHMNEEEEVRRSG